MNGFPALILPAFDTVLFTRTILSYPISHYLYDALTAAGGKIYCAGAFCGLESRELAGHFPDPEDIGSFFQGESGPALLIFAPMPTLTAADILGLLRAALEEGRPVSLRSGKLTLAVAGELEALRGLNLSDLRALTALEAPEIPAAVDAESLFDAQEILRRRINLGHLRRGVFMADLNTTHIAPQAVLEPGCQLLPGCMLLGESRVGAGCVIGPNAYLEDAVLAENVRVNASQIYGSRVGAGTTVGPFAHIRPGCDVGENVRVGNFVELKNTTLGGGTKVSHLTYLGDSDLGSGINVGCGVVTVNYDGKRKHRTVVEDGSFIGCNVNLVAPVTVERDAYVAAGTTVTERVPAGSMAVGRARAAVKPGWVARKRAEGKL